MLGRRFGRLVVLRQEQADRYRNSMWLCACDCGGMKVARGINLSIGSTQSCGCIRRKRNADRPANQRPERELANLTFGSWTVQTSYRKDAAGHRQWLCVCACGTERYIEASALTRGRSKSCGCVLPWWPSVVAGKQWNLDNAR